MYFERWATARLNPWAVPFYRTRGSRRRCRVTVRRGKPHTRYKTSCPMLPLTPCIGHHPPHGVLHCCTPYTHIEEGEFRCFPRLARSPAYFFQSTYTSPLQTFYSVGEKKGEKPR